jgi:hypothetical protein
VEGQRGLKGNYRLEFGRAGAVVSSVGVVFFTIKFYARDADERDREAGAI